MLCGRGEKVWDAVDGPLSLSLGKLTAELDGYGVNGRRLGVVELVGCRLGGLNQWAGQQGDGATATADADLPWGIHGE